MFGNLVAEPIHQMIYIYIYIKELSVTHGVYATKYRMMISDARDYAKHSPKMFKEMDGKTDAT